MEMFLGLIKYRPNTTWFEIYKLIKADTKEEAEIKLKKWADENVIQKDKILFVTSTL